MRKPLQNNSEIKLYEIGTDKKFNFRITDVIGMGASCIVYTAVYTDLQKNEFTLRLKELYPMECEITREPDNSLKCSSDDFEKHLTRFTDGYKKQLKFRQFLESMNSISNIQGIYEGNGTRYIAMSCQNGIGIDDTDLSLYDIFRVLKAVTLQIENFHRNGYLYLDLKPDNIILYPETPELVMLFDFDSAVTAYELKENPSLLSYTQKYSAPEVCQQKVNKIGIASDVYTLGALLMYMLFKRSPSLTDRRRNASWDSELDRFLADESPEVKRMITDIFRNTLSADPLKRYKSCNDLLNVIEPFILSFQKEKPYLKTVIPLGNNYFCGRSAELSEIHNVLKTETNFLILHGIGGIGKSELAKHYAMTYKSDYDAAVFVRFQKNMMQTIVSDMNFPVVNCKRSDDESDEEYLNRKINILQKICTDRHLIILDNFDVDDCDDLELLTGLPCNILVTSRVDYSDVFYQYEVEELQNEDDIFSLVTYYYKENLNEENTEAVWNIINAVEGHTMAIELIAKHMQNLKITPIEMYEKLSQNGIVSGSDGKVRNVKDGSLKSKTAYAHISALFSIFGLSEDIKQVLRYAALFGPNLIDKGFFIDICNLTEEQKTAMESAITCGWIQEFIITDATAVILHPLVSDVLCYELKPDAEHCGDFIETATVISSDLKDFDSEQRYLHIVWLDHMARNIHGNSAKITFFLYHLNMVYLAEEDYESAKWCNEKIVEMIYALPEDEECSRELLSSYLFLKMIARINGDSELEKEYIDKVKALNSVEAITQWHDTHKNMLLDECSRLLENLIEAKIALNGEESMEVAEWYMEYSDMLRLKNDEDGCYSFMKTAMELYNDLLDEDNELLGDLYCRASDSFLYFGDTEKSLDYLDRAIEICEVTGDIEAVESLLKYRNDTFKI